MGIPPLADGLSAQGVQNNQAAATVQSSLEAGSPSWKHYPFGTSRPSEQE